MFTTAALHPVSIYDKSTTSLSAPLIQSNSTEEEQHVPESSSTLKRSSLLLGFIVGLFIQFSTLGANYLVISVYGNDVLTSSKQDIVLFSLVWSFFTSTLAIIILGFLRNLMAATFQGSADRFDTIILHVECRFVVGALVGVCMAWSGTDALLGMSAQIIYSMATLAVALVWCRIMMYFFAHDVESIDEADTSSLRNQQQTNTNNDAVMIV